MEVPSELVAFCRREHPRIVGSLRLYTGDPHLAEELAQDTFVRVCRDWERVRDMASPGGWTQRVALNLANSRYRRRTAERRMRSRVAALAAGERHREDALPDTSTAEALLQLSHEERAVVILRFYVDLSIAQVADALGLPEGTVKSRTRRALRSLRERGLITQGELSDVQ